MKIGTSRGHEKSCKEIKQNHTSRKKISLLQSRQRQNRKHGNSYENCNFQTTFHQKQSVSPRKREISRKDSKKYGGSRVQEHKAHGIQENYKKFAEKQSHLIYRHNPELPEHIISGFFMHEYYTQHPKYKRQKHKLGKSKGRPFVKHHRIYIGFSQIVKI